MDFACSSSVVTNSANLCIFRAKSITHSDLNRSPNPEQIDHLFRFKSIAYSGTNRSLIPI